MLQRGRRQGYEVREMRRSEEGYVNFLLLGLDSTADRKVCGFIFSGCQR